MSEKKTIKKSRLEDMTLGMITIRNAVNHAVSFADIESDIEYIILRQVVTRPGARPSEIASVSGAPRNRLSEHLRRLSSQGLIVVEKATNDRRGRRCFPAVAGSTVADACRMEIEREVESIASCLNPGEYAGLCIDLIGTAMSFGQVEADRYGYSLGDAFAVCGYRFVQLTTGFARGYDLSLAEYRTLLAMDVLNQQFLRPCDICRHSTMGKSTVASAMRTLTKKELVEWHDNAGLRSSTAVKMTERGAQVCENATQTYGALLTENNQRYVAEGEFEYLGGVFAKIAETQRRIGKRKPK